MQSERPGLLQHQVALESYRALLASGGVHECVSFNHWRRDSVEIAPATLGCRAAHQAAVPAW